MSTQTDFDDVTTSVKSSKIPRALLRNSENTTGSRIPRPVMTRAKTLDSMPSRKKKDQGKASVTSTPTRTATTTTGTVERPGMRREKSDIPPSMRREKSNLSARKKKATPRSNPPTPRRVGELFCSLFLVSFCSFCKLNIHKILVIILVKNKLGKP